MSLIFSISGLRGVVSKDLKESIISFYATSFARYLKARRLVIGCDTRKSSEMFLNATINALVNSGHNVINLGCVPTPTVVFMVRKLGADAGLVITASHNPPAWNGMKFVSGCGEFINERDFSKFARFVEEIAPCRVKLQNVIIRTKIKVHNEPLSEHLVSIINCFKLHNIGLKVGVDAAGGAGSIALPLLLEMAGCRVYKINCRYQSDFPRKPEPLPENITELCRLVRDKKLDLGFALDPDADRLAIVDENGNAISEEKTLVLATDCILAEKPGPVVTNLSTTGLMDYIARKYKCKLYRTRVGEANVVDKMNKVKAIIGGEGNGGVIYPAINATRDSLTGAGIILKLLTTRKKSIHEIVREYPEYYMIKQKVYIPREEFGQKKLKLIKKFKGRINQLDGLKIICRDFWLHIRPSNTEPLVRIIGEGRDKSQTAQYLNQAIEILNS